MSCNVWAPVLHTDTDKHANNTWHPLINHTLQILQLFQLGYIHFLPLIITLNSPLHLLTWSFTQTPLKRWNVAKKGNLEREPNHHRTWGVKSLEIRAVESEHSILPVREFALNSILLHSDGYSTHVTDYWEALYTKVLHAPAQRRCRRRMGCILLQHKYVSFCTTCFFPLRLINWFLTSHGTGCLSVVAKWKTQLLLEDTRVSFEASRFLASE